MTGGCASPEVCGRTAVCLLQLEESVHSWGLRACVCVCLGKQQWLGRGLWERAIKTNAVPPVMQVDGAGRLPLANRHLVKVTFPKKAMTHGTPRPPVYVTVPVKGLMAWHWIFQFGGVEG